MILNKYHIWMVLHQYECWVLADLQENSIVLNTYYISIVSRHGECTNVESALLSEKMILNKHHIWNESIILHIIIIQSKQLSYMFKNFIS